MAEFIDREFGTIRVRHNLRATSIKVRIGNDGKLVVSAPKLTPQFYIKRVVGQSRGELRKLLAVSTPAISIYIDGQLIGKTHTLKVVHSNLSSTPRAQIVRGNVVVYLPDGFSIESPDVQSLIRPKVIAALRVEARKLLPDRLAKWAQTGGFSYERVRFSHAAGRWGSCSSNGTISLNIALMKLPETLIDYVLVHELCHTIEMNHSGRFWALVERYDPLYKQHRKLIKQHTPAV